MTAESKTCPLCSNAPKCCCQMSSLLKKFVMALTGLLLTLFVLGHMLGNLQIFMEPEAINKYAYFLHHILPVEVLWVIRFVLLGAVVAHAVVAAKLKLENAEARPVTYDTDKTLAASTGSRTMMWTGSIILAFVIFHLLHFTVQSTHPEVRQMQYILDGKITQDVYAMMVYGFSSTFWYVSAFYIVAVTLLCWHLSHGVSSMFQTLGIRNEKWRYRLDRLAWAYGFVVFAGFAAVPAGVLISEHTSLNLVHAKTILSQTNAWNGEGMIFIHYPSEQDFTPLMIDETHKLPTP